MKKLSGRTRVVGPEPKDRSKRDSLALRALLPAVVLLAGLALAACGSSSTTSTSTSSPGAATSTSSASGAAPYKVGVIASSSGPIAASVGGFGTAMQAWAKWTNSHGGIGGHQVQLISEDDAGSPTTALAEAKTLIQQDHVIAVFNGSGSEEAYASYMAAQKVPVIGGLDVSTTYETNGDFFSQGSSPKAGILGAMMVGAQEGHNKLAVPYCVEVPACARAAQLAKQYGPKIGVKLVYSSGISSSAPNYTAQCIAAKAAGANALYVSAGVATALKLATDCARQGLTVPLETNSLNFSNQWLKSPASAGAISSVPEFPFTDSSTPATQAFQAAMKQSYGSQQTTDPLYGETQAEAWASGQLFVAATQGLGNSPTAAGVRAGLYALHGSTLNGLTPPITYTQGLNPNANLNCFMVMKIVGGKFTEPQGLKTSCVHL
jgi:branched-chain amino acid transport system substrate-binding protein